MTESPIRVAILHGAGLVGGELVRLLLAHPHARIMAVTSRAFAGQPVATAHPSLRGVTDLAFAAPADLDADTFDAAFVCAEHGAGARTVASLRAAGFDGLIVDLSADHRLADAAGYPAWYGFEHPAPYALAGAVYGLTDVFTERLPGARLVANPGCFATGISLALWPLVSLLGSFEAHVTALTGASGSGAKPSAATHFPTRDGNVRAYKALGHQHLAEVGQTLGPDVAVHFVPASGPWTRGIGGTTHVALPASVSANDVGAAFEAAY
ncbi:MAG TPA: N-acetyl-gamma-glutamyl-phosphate reductase, partial [Rubricoccaceae bacterium]